MNAILPIFSSDYSFGSSILTLDEPRKSKPGTAVSIFDMAIDNGLKQVVVVDDRLDGFIEGYKSSLKAGVQFVFGLKMTICADISDKTKESELTESNIIILLRNSQAYYDLIKLNNRAWVVGSYNGRSRLDWKTLKELWTPNFSLALGFFSSFLSRNLLTMASIVPDLPALPTVFREIESDLPFAPLIDKAIDQYVASTGAVVQPVKSVYYRDAAAFPDYVTFRARFTKSKGKIGTFSDPGVDHLCSDRFSLQCWRELA